MIKKRLPADLIAHQLEVIEGKAEVDKGEGENLEEESSEDQFDRWVKKVMQEQEQSLEHY